MSADVADIASVCLMREALAKIVQQQDKHYRHLIKTHRKSLCGMWSSTHVESLYRGDDFVLHTPQIALLDARA